MAAGVVLQALRLLLEGDDQATSAAAYGTSPPSKKMDDSRARLVRFTVADILTRFSLRLGSLSSGKDEATELAGFVAVVQIASCTYTTRYRISYLVVLVKLAMRWGGAI